MVLVLEGGIGEALDQAEELPASLKLTDRNRLSVIVAVVWHGPSIPGDRTTSKNPNRKSISKRLNPLIGFDWFKCKKVNILLQQTQEFWWYLRNLEDLSPGFVRSSLSPNLEVWFCQTRKMRGDSGHNRR